MEEAGLEVGAASGDCGPADSIRWTWKIDRWDAELDAASRGRPARRPVKRWIDDIVAFLNGKGIEVVWGSGFEEFGDDPEIQKLVDAAANQLSKKNKTAKMGAGKSATKGKRAGAA